VEITTHIVEITTYIVEITTYIVRQKLRGKSVFKNCVYMGQILQAM
jgi:hypothetical protein